MVTHMKTTIDIADDLLKKAKTVAQRESTTLKALTEEGLRRVLSERESGRVRKRVRPFTVKGKGLTPEAKRMGLHQMILSLYEERSK